MVVQDARDAHMSEKQAEERFVEVMSALSCLATRVVCLEDRLDLMGAPKPPPRKATAATRSVQRVSTVAIAVHRARTAARNGDAVGGRSPLGGRASSQGANGRGAGVGTASASESQPVPEAEALFM